MSLHVVPLAEAPVWLSAPYWLTAPELAGVPAGFAAYVKLLPPLGIDRSIPIEAYPRASRTVEDLQARASFWTAHGIVRGKPPEARVVPTTYRAVAQWLGLPYTPALGADALVAAFGSWPPHLGTTEAMEVAFLERIVALLGPQTATYFHGTVDEGNYRWGPDGFPVDWLERGVAADLLTVCRRDGAFPSYVFAADHRWCIYEGEWTDWKIIAGSQALAQAFLDAPDLETFRITL
jgi:hypothetical protein